MPTRPTIDVSYGPPGAIASAVEFARRGDTVVATTRNLADSSSFDMRSWIVYVSTAIGVGSRRQADGAVIARACQGIIMKTGRSMTDVVGGTPLVQLGKVVPDGAADVFVKLEWFNPTGSYKDRMALAMIEQAERRGDLRPGMTVLEYTAGSTGSSLAYVCAAKGYRFKVVTSDAFAAEKLATMAALGAELTIVPSVGGKITPDLTPRMIETARELADDPNVYWTDQLHNADSLVGYHQVGVELLEQMERPIDLFCCAVGTSGMATGVTNALEEAGSPTRVVIFEPDSSPVISTGEAGVNSVEGIGIGIVPPLLDLERFDEVRAVSEQDAFAMARRLASEEGLFAGGSTGLNVTGAIELAQELGAGQSVVTLACDTGLKYLAGGLFRR